jgi:Flp pilus assembly protein protease CpaA
MWFMIVTVLALVWDWLPQITIVLKFCTALIGFVIVVPLLVRRVRRWRRRSR